MELSRNILKKLTAYIVPTFQNDVHSDHVYVFDSSVAVLNHSGIHMLKVCVYETSRDEFGLRTDDGGFKPNMWVNISGGFLEKNSRLWIFINGSSTFLFLGVKNIRALANLLLVRLTY